MKTVGRPNILNLRKPVSHFFIAVLSFASCIYVMLRGDNQGSSGFPLEVFFMVLLQIEAFIFLGNLLFAKVNFDKSPVEITRIIIFRFAVFLAACLLISMLLFIFLQYAVLFFKEADTSGVIRNFIHSGFTGWFRSTVKGLTVGAIIFIVMLWQTSLRREQKLREENLIFQNETLKSQVNPHFLFNSLNTVSSLIQSDPEKAEEFINNLSSVYRYILENGQKDKVMLQSELDLINKYFDLHRVRDEEKITLNIDYTGVDNFQILPVSLQILLENAIKHNISSREKPLNISVYFEEQYIIVKNNLQKKATQIKSTGRGLKNLAERFRLVSGKNLIIDETNDWFIVKLPLLK